jgi:hypothetical protein
VCLKVHFDDYEKLVIGISLSLSLTNLHLNHWKEKDALIIPYSLLFAVSISYLVSYST